MISSRKNHPNGLEVAETSHRLPEQENPMAKRLKKMQQNQRVAACGLRQRRVTLLCTARIRGALCFPYCI
ncbi:hypothetical protein E2542_SST10683 [Spatholobus suberectus]|nr:hypothetical protein E2542_SST10683 [Spatholobus suberectus]